MESVVLGSESSRGDAMSVASGVFGQLGYQIRIEMLDDGKKRSVRDAIDSIKTLYDLYASELQGHATKTINSSSSVTQASPLVRNQEAKR